MSWWDRFWGKVKDFWDWLDTSDLADNLKEAFQKFWDAIVDYIWTPTKSFLEGIIGGLWSVWQGVSAVLLAVQAFTKTVTQWVERKLEYLEPLVNAALGAVEAILQNFGELVAGVFLDTFVQFIEEVLELVEDWIDDHWDD
jgi:phage-related protein